MMAAAFLWNDNRLSAACLPQLLGRSERHKLVIRAMIQKDWRGHFAYRGKIIEAILQ